MLFRPRYLFNRLFHTNLLSNKYVYFKSNLTNYTEILTNQSQIFNTFRQIYSKKQKQIYSYYCSQYDKIILDQQYMLIPIDERMATRAHAVFDTIYIKHMKIINMHAHIHRLLRSAKSLGIESPFTAQQIEKKIIDLVEAAFYKILKTSNQKFLKDSVFGLRINISSGHGDFGIASQGKRSIFYATVFQPFFKYELQKQGVKQYVAKQMSTVISEFVHTKTVNYAQNALMANYSKRKGGYQGIKVTKDKVILQASVANVGFIFKQKEFATPRLQTVIEGTTLKQLIPKLNSMIKNNQLNKVSFRDITVDQALTANEMMIIGGDKIVPVLKFNDHQISSKKGPITTLLQNWYQQSIQEGTPIILKNSFV